MANKTITFDPESGVPYGANLAIYGGTDFSTTFTESKKLPQAACNVVAA